MLPAADPAGAGGALSFGEVAGAEWVRERDLALRARRDGGSKRAAPLRRHGGAPTGMPRSFCAAILNEAASGEKFAAALRRLA